MASSTFWKGNLKLSNVTCSIALISATPKGESLFFPEDAYQGRDCNDRTIDIETFVTKTATDYRQYETAHFMVADDMAGEDAFSDIRAMMEKTGTVAICNVLLGQRELTGMIEPRDTGMVLWTLRAEDDLPALFFPGYKAPKPTSNVVSLHG